MKNFKLISFGEVALDVILCGVDQVPKRWSILGKTKSADIFAAGSAGYVAQCFAKLGGRASIVGKIGNDNAGPFILNGFKRLGVSTQHLVIEKGAKTEISTVILYNNQNKVSVVSEILPLRLKEFDTRCLIGGNAFHVGGYLLYPNLWRGRILPWLRSAKQEGELVSADPQMSATSKWHQPFRGILEHLDLLLLDEEEAKKISRKERLVEAIELLQREGTDVVAVKTGEKGCVIGTRGRIEPIAPFKTNPISTIGAGDAFDAAFIYGSLQGWSIEKRGLFANAVAAISTTRLGCMTAIPKANSVEKIIISHKAKSDTNNMKL
jgi:sugar/nucleoside kinase (ribokinase family)